MAWWQIAYWVAVGGTLITQLLLLTQTLEHRRYARSRARRGRPTPPPQRVALFVPCKGDDGDLEANLRPMLQQDHPNHEVVFIVESVDDEAYEPIRRLLAEYPDRQARLVIAGLATTAGQKVHNLLVATEHLPDEIGILAFADADIRPPHDWLLQLTQRLSICVASTGYRRFIPKRPTLANLIVASIDTAVVPIMFPSIHHKVWGGSWAIRRDAFEIGRMRDAWQGTLSDDLVAANVLARMKQPLALETSCILPSPIDLDMWTMLAWVRRQFIIGRFYSPLLWAVVAVGHCFNQLVFWASVTTALAAWWQGAAWAWQPAAVAGGIYAMQVLRGWLRQRSTLSYLPHCQRELAAARHFDIWCSPVSAAALCVALVASGIGRRIRWKDNVYEMSYGGQIRKIPSTADRPAPRAPHGTAGSRRAA
ncbi:MAG: glycosyltransferase [Pirellulales bacterium]